MHPSFEKTVDAVRQIKITLPAPATVYLDFNLDNFSAKVEVLDKVESIKAYELNPKKGLSFLENSNYYLCAYDESIQKFKALEGSAYLCSHSLIMHDEDDYISSNFLTFYFYTRSLELCKKSTYIKLSNDVESDFKRDYAKDRADFLENNTPENSILLVDGPLIGGQISSITIDTNFSLLEKNIIPIFFVKNSDSNLVVDYIKDINGKYNSDLHWAYSFLKEGERTNFFKYTDNTKNRKIFCYLKAFDGSPQRVEFHIETCRKYYSFISDIMDLVYYLLLAQGNIKNPQVRSIAIAEIYARNTLQLFDFTRIMKDLGITPIINEQRFRG